MYTVKPVWTSYLTFIEEAEADAAFQVELGSSACNSAAVNTGKRGVACCASAGGARHPKLDTLLYLLTLLALLNASAIPNRQLRGAAHSRFHRHV